MNYRDHMAVGRRVVGTVLTAVTTLTCTGCISLIYGPTFPIEPPDLPIISPYATDEEYVAFMWMTLNRGDLWLRANTCSDQQLVTGFTLGASQGSAARTWPITPDDGASIRMGSFEEISQLVRDGATEATITGIEGPILPLDLSDDRLDLLTETATSDDNTLLVGTADGTVLVTDMSFFPEKVLREICAPADPDEPGRYKSDE